MAAKKTTPKTSPAPAKKAAKKVASKVPAKKAAPKAAKKAAAKAPTKNATAPPPAVSFDQIAAAAYQVYLRRIELGLPGDQHSDWAEAEKQLGVAK